MKTTHIYGIFAIFIMVLFQKSAFSSDVICKIDQVSSTEKGIEVHFNGNVNLNGTVVDNNAGSSKFLVKATTSSPANGIVKSILLKEESVAYVANGFTESCVLRYANNEGRVGIKIEEMSHMPNKPPVLRSEFVEAN